MQVCRVVPYWLPVAVGDLPCTRPSRNYRMESMGDRAASIQAITGDLVPGSTGGPTEDWGLH